MICGGLRTKGITKASQPGKPLISVVTVVRNGVATLEQTILSVVNQTYDNVEYIVIDGASTDGTLDVIRKYEDRIDLWQSEPDGGIYYAMNKGIGLATGEYVALLNAGDWYEIDTVSEIVRNVHLAPDTDIFYGMMRIYSEKKVFLWVYGYVHNYIDHAMVSHPTSFVRKALYSNHKYDLNYKSAADYDLFLTFYSQGYSFRFVEKILGNYILGGMSDSYVGKKETAKVLFKHKKLSYCGLVFRLVYYTILKFIM